MHSLTFDLGTTYLKVAVFDPELNLVDLERVATPVVAEGVRRECDAGELIAALTGAARAIASRRPGEWSKIGCVSYSSQANSFLLLDGADKPLTPIVLWTDARAREFEPAMGRLGGLPGFRQTTGMPRAWSQLGVAKALWFRAYRPELWEKARRLCFISDYLTLWLTGRWRGTGGIAGLSGVFDIGRLDWWDAGLSAIGLPRGLLPPVGRAGERVGELTDDAALSLGLPGGVVFRLGCLDQYCGAIGVGGLSPGVVCETTGTVLAAVRGVVGERPAAGGDVYQGPGVREGHWWQMAFSSTSANLLEHYRSTLPGRPGYEELSALAARAGDGVEIGAVADETDLAASFAGVAAGEEAGRVVRGIMRRVAVTLGELVGELSRGGEVRELRSAGGAARSEVWLEIKRRTLGLPIARGGEEPTSRGAAMLARGLT